MANTKKPKEKKEYVKEKLRLNKRLSKKNKHRARLVVYNLPFTATEDNVREHFQKFGEIDEVKVLKKENEQILGCGFVQFKLVQKAAKARHHLNGKPFLDRVIECDWALPKDKYLKKKNEEGPVKIKEEPIDDIPEIQVEIKEEPLDDEVAEVKTENEDVSDREESEKSVEEEEDEEENDLDDIKFVEENTTESKQKVISNDATEGKTVFIKNVPFTATDEDIRNCMAQFGPLYYALACVDHLTEHSKGTAFVKFRNKADADTCLSTPGITLMGNILDCQCALTKDELNKKSNEKKIKGPKDSRNLYLVKEGVILAGNKAAEGVSASDMAKRLQIEQYKTQMLRNLNMFVARTRLIVHNIPESWDDAKLRQLFTKYSAPKTVIKEARIMRNMRLTDGWGVGKSKEFGFVTFTTHDGALHALRAVNNNPKIFSEKKRPIVAFSIENRAKLHAKEKRLQNSRVKNPKCKNYDPKAANINKDNEKREIKRPATMTNNEEPNTFSGILAAPGVTKMRSKFNLKTQAQIHHEHLKKVKKSKKLAKKTFQEKQKDFTKQPRQKINKNKIKVSDNFSKIINSYKQKLLQATEGTQVKRQKWYEAS